MTKVRMLIGIRGPLEGTDGAERGDVIEVADASAERLYAQGYARPAHLEPLGQPFKPYEH
jgi:hypothetical protein